MARRGIKCAVCGYVGLSVEFRSGRGRHLAEHPEHRYCPVCRCSIDWYGHRWVDLPSAHAQKVTVA